MGDLVIGELTAKDEATGGITVKYLGKNGPEIFSGILAEGYKLRIAEGGTRSLNLSDFALGSHIRVFYKGGKINKISRMEFLGNDEFFRLRSQLKVDPSTAVTLAETDNLPAMSTLKVYPAIAVTSVQQQLADWNKKWNQKNGDSYGKLEFVSDFEEADILLVVARGSDWSVAVLPMLSSDGREVEGQWSHATSYLVVKDVGRLKVLWSGVAPVFTGDKAEVSLKTTELLIAELEKRMKARAGNTKK